MPEWLMLRRLALGSDFALLAARLLTGSFLIHGVWDNVTSSERMAEFADFLAFNGFPAPALAASFSVYTQLLAGIALVLGLFTRWAGIIITITFITGWVMVHSGQSWREGWPAIALIALGLCFATAGGGRIALDANWERR